MPLELKHRCSVEMAALYALAFYLEAEFDKLYDRNVSSERVVVNAGWPASGSNLPERSVSVVMAGTRQETHLTEEVVSKTDIPGGNLAVFEWSVKAITQPIQLDIWARHPAVRNQLCDDLDTILHRGPAYTIGVGGAPVRDGVLVRLPEVSGHAGIVDYTTLNGPRPIEDSNAVQSNESRALISAELDVILTVKATSAKLAVVQLKGALSGAPYETTLQKDGGAFEIASSQL
jgi:hypothetical protein